MRLVQWIDRVSEWSGRAAAWLTLGAVLILTYEVIVRYVFDAPTQWAHDTSTLLLGVMYALTGAYGMVTKNHVGVDILSTRLSPRARATLDAVTSVFFFLFVGVIFWQGWRFFDASFARREFSLNNQAIPIYPAKLAIPLGAALLLLQGVAQLIRDVYLAVTGRPPDGREVAPSREPEPGTPQVQTTPQVNEAPVYSVFRREDAE
ncbi:TRAP transporter small permease subunit [Limnochorda pilosa]|uniref:TRAP transporter small permease subunit n=1 Tax=Limnochorda pilosa TaxID=1555112 RepID=UPI001E34E388|nr:TRAP transporter small permease subunit [Limnochorda pilosa]